MSVGLDVEAELFLGLEIDSELPCDRPEHGAANSIGHGGPGEVYVVFRCPACGSTDDVPGNGLQLIFEKFYEHMLSLDNMAGHKGCGKRIRMGDLVVFKGRR